MRRLKITDTNVLERAYEYERPFMRRDLSLQLDVIETALAEAKLAYSAPMPNGPIFPSTTLSTRPLSAWRVKVTLPGAAGIPILGALPRFVTRRRQQREP